MDRKKKRQTEMAAPSALESVNWQAERQTKRETKQTKVTQKVDQSIKRVIYFF